MMSICLLVLTTAWRAIGSQASGWLNLLGLLVAIKDTSLTWHLLDALTMNILNASDVVGHIGVVVVPVVNDALSVQVIAIDLGDHSLVDVLMVSVLSNYGLNIIIKCIHISN